MKKLIFASLLLLPIGCKSDNMIDADRIKSLVETVSERHDAYVDADETLSPELKTFYKNSTQRLLSLVNAASDGEVEGETEPVE